MERERVEKGYACTSRSLCAWLSRVVQVAHAGNVEGVVRQRMLNGNEVVEEGNDPRMRCH